MRVRKELNLQNMYQHRYF